MATPPRTIQDIIRRRIGTPGFAGGTLEEQLQADDIARQQRRPQMDYRTGVDDVTVLPSGKIELIADPFRYRSRPVIPPFSANSPETPRTLQDFDTYQLDPSQRRKGEPLSQAIRRIDTSRAAMGKPVEEGEYLTNTIADPLNVPPPRGMEMRPRRAMPPLRADEFAPPNQPLSAGTFAGDAPDLRRPSMPSSPAMNLPTPWATPPEPPVPAMAAPQYGQQMHDPRTGEPHREFYQRGGDPLQERMNYRDQLQKWQPQGKRGLRDILKSAGISALLGAGANPENPLAGAIGGAGAGVTGQLVNPSFGGMLTRNLKVKRENAALDQGMQDAYRQAQTDWMRQRPDIEAGKAAEQQRRTLTSIYNRLPEFDPTDPANADLVDAMTKVRLPAVPKSRANQLRFVQDARTGEWMVMAGDRSTGEATAQPITTSEGASAVTTSTAQITAENQAANRASRERVAALNRTSRETISELNRRARISGGRGDAREEARLTRAVKEITDLENLKTDALSGPAQGRVSALEKATTKASEIRRLYGDLIEVGYGSDSEGRQWPYAKMKQQGAQRPQQSGAMGRPPASDGKHHYTASEIRSQAEAAGVSYESLYNKLKSDKRVVIDR